MEGEASKIGGNLPVAVEIRFRANDIYDQLGWAILLQFFQPAFNILKSRSICDVVQKEGRISASIIHGCHAPKSLLTCSIPQLQAYLEPVNVHLLRYKKSTARRCRVLGVEPVLGITLQQTSFTDARVAHYDNLAVDALFITRP